MSEVILWLSFGIIVIGGMCWAFRKPKIDDDARCDDSCPEKGYVFVAKSTGGSVPVEIIEPVYFSGTLGALERDLGHREIGVSAFRPLTGIEKEFQAGPTSVAEVVTELAPSIKPKAAKKAAKKVAKKTKF